MSNIRYFLFLTILCIFAQANAQRDYRDYLRGGNKLYTDSIFDKSEIQYRKAIEKDANGVDALYNLGNSLLLQNKAKDAMDQYQIVEKRENNPERLAQVHHNKGVIHHGSKDYAAAVEAYKESLRKNPHDHETRYNLALAMHHLKQQQQQDQQQQQQEQEKKEEEKQEQQQQQNQNQKEQEQQEQEQQQNQQQQQQEQQQQMSKENAEQMLQAAMQDEKDVQEKVKKMMQMQGRKLEKDW
ncbi:MAG: tetratricopeptide repeat protein [Bacteroidaceae bacterium]|nr:tetratricopeptide repeat protein [Bacteroidaceae bacterium]MBQ4038114.1 tetratricopeptide repeat protein [Bacteroidaceae bacterium]